MAHELMSRHRTPWQHSVLNAEDYVPGTAAPSPHARLTAAASAFSQGHDVNMALTEIMHGLAAVLAQQEKQAASLARLEAGERRKLSRARNQDPLSKRAAMKSAVESALPAKEAPPRQFAGGGKGKELADGQIDFADACAEASCSQGESSDAPTPKQRSTVLVPLYEPYATKREKSALLECCT